MTSPRITAPTFELTDVTLDNGLRVVIAPDPTVPVTAVNLWYDVGSRHEQPGRTGLAHLFEHLMFEGSAHVPKGEHFQAVNAAGGTLNATTWCDRTNYFDTVPSNHLELVLWLEADRMGGLSLTQETLDNQRAVVKNERRQRYENQPYGIWMERMHAAAYPDGHPYHHSTIGSMDDLDAASLADVRDFYASHYGPDNAVVTVVGDVEFEAALAAARTSFGGLPRRARPPAEPPDTAVPALIGAEVRETVPDRVPLPRTFLGYRIDPFGTGGYEAAVLLAAVLGNGRGSRLYRRLVLERQLAQADDRMADTFPFVGGAALAVIDLAARDGVDPADLLAGYDEVVAEVVDSGVTEQELERAYAVVAAEWLHHVSALDGRADAFSQYATLFGDPRLVNDVLPRLATVGVDDVLQAAQHRLLPEHRVVLGFVPERQADAA